MGKIIKLVILTMILISVFTLPVLAETPGIRGPMVLIADDSKHTYLGQLTANEYATDSVFNKYGLYGSKYAENSTNNEYGVYGGKYSAYSPYNKYTSTPPLIVDADGDTVGTLSVNRYLPGAVSPYLVYDALTRLGL